MRSFLLFTISLYCAFCFSQCPEGNITLLSQAEVENFVSAYPNCDTIDGFLIVSGNDIVDVSVLSQITTVGSILISDTSLTSMQGLNALTIAGITLPEDAFVVIDNNPLLQDIIFLDNYTFNVPIVFLIRDMPQLTSLEGSENITEFINIYLENNDALTDLNALNPNLNIVGGVIEAPLLYLSDNAVLSNILRLNSVQYNSALTAEITDNEQLEICENDLVCELVNNGAIVIANNAIGCNSISEVDLACESLSIDGSTDVVFKSYPNPTQSILNFSANTIIETIVVYNTLGENVITITPKVTQGTIDMSHLSDGFYFLKVKSNSKENIFKVLKD